LILDIKKAAMRIIGGFVFLLFVLGACAPAPTPTESDKLHVVATTGMVADLVQAIGGSAVLVDALMGPGVDPHLYKATQGDLSRLQEADLVVYNGLHLEGKMGEILEKLGRRKPVVAVADGLPRKQLLQDTLFSGNYDPHVWFDVSLWAATVPVVRDALVQADSSQRDYFMAQAARYEQQLGDLHRWVRDTLQVLPEGRRVVVTAHDAFNYFGRAYDLEVRGLQGISTLSEFGLRDRVDLVNFLVEQGISAVFVETSVSTKNIESIIEGCRQKGHIVRIGGNLYSDAMGAAGTPEGTYIGMVQANVRTLIQSLNAN
jgi:manganese/zinc/iron transport system substrate-binding protein